MSRVGKTPIEIPAGITVEVSESKVVVKGPKGELSQDIRHEVQVDVKEGQVLVSVNKETKKAPAFWGLTRALIANMIKGVSEGFEKKLELVGVGYRAKQVSNDTIEMTLGFSHSIKFKAPESVELKVEDEKNITVTGPNKQLVGLAAANIRKFRKPEPYKGKGVRYKDEVVRKKPGKAGKVGAGGAGA
ncbi:50S ribosomal protein L6 [Patescibacteria group bacterium]|nr:50S ribosomal protein L6 [Patescibacteria group bacterium]